MQEWSSIDEILDFAIHNEEEAYRFYIDLAERSSGPLAKKIFTDFAREEQGHKARLELVKKGGTLRPAQKRIPDLKLADYLVDTAPSPDLDYQQALILAMKKEKAAFKLYTDLAAIADDASVQEAFTTLAQEEAKHKLRFEVEYDREILREN